MMVVILLASVNDVVGVDVLQQVLLMLLLLLQLLHHGAQLAAIAALKLMIVDHLWLLAVAVHLTAGKHI